MSIFLIAILLSLMVRWISQYLVLIYMEMGKTEKELNKSFIFNASVTCYLVSSGILYVNVTVLSAFLVRFYFL